MQLPPRTSSLRRAIGGLGATPSFVQMFTNPEFEKKLIESISVFQPDTIHFDFINVCGYVSCLPSGLHTVASVNDSMALSMENRLKVSAYRNPLKRIGKWMQLHQIRGYERRMYPKFNTVHLMTEVDATYLKQLNGDIHTTVIANGVDNKLFKISLENEKPGTVVFVGELKGSNLLGLRRFIEEGWPIVLDRCPDAQLKVVGGMVCLLYTSDAADE